MPISLPEYWQTWPDREKNRIENVVNELQRTVILDGLTRGWPATDFDLFMRPKNDNRKDAIVKAELYAQHIADRYYVEFVVDDRQQVVDMWRRTLGLTCVQPGRRRG